jgi:hypothetical protein
MEGGYLHENVNLASPTFGEHSFFLALRDKKEALHSSEGYNLYFLACQRHGTPKEEKNVGPSG